MLQCTWESRMVAGEVDVGFEAGVVMDDVEMSVGFAAGLDGDDFGGREVVVCFREKCGELVYLLGIWKHNHVDV